MDLGSTDRSVSVATDRLGAAGSYEIEPPVGVRRRCSARDWSCSPAVRSPAREEAPVEWIWLLHDDSAPEPDALDELLLRVCALALGVARRTEGARLGRTACWCRPGLTIDSAGTFDTGLDRREPDQGQRDDVDEVLAVGIAGALVRRDVWEYLGGEDPAWSEYAAEVDLGWRVNAAGRPRRRRPARRRAPCRRVDCSGRRPCRLAELRAQTVRRRNGMRVVLANTAGWLVPLLLLRYVRRRLAAATRPRRAVAPAARGSCRADSLSVQVLAAPGAIVASRRSRRADP